MVEAPEDLGSGQLEEWKAQGPVALKRGTDEWADQRGGRWSTVVHFPQWGWILGWEALRCVALTGLLRWKYDFILGETVVADQSGLCWCCSALDARICGLSGLPPSVGGEALPVGSTTPHCPSLGICLLLVSGAGKREGPRSTPPGLIGVRGTEVLPAHFKLKVSPIED